MSKYVSRKELLDASQQTTERIPVYSINFPMTHLVKAYTSYESIHMENLEWIEKCIDGKYSWLAVSYGVRYYFYEEDDLSYFILSRYV